MGIKRFLVRVASFSLAIFLFFSSIPPALVLAAGSLTVSGTVTNQSGGGVLNVSVYATAPGGSITSYGPVTTNSSGAYSLGIDPGTYDVHFDPPSGSGLNPIVDNNYTVSANQTLNVQLTSPQHTLSGYLRDGNGNPVPSVTIQFRNYNTGTTTSATTTDSTGHYSLTATAGIYTVNNIGGTAPSPIGSLNIGDAYGSSTGAQYNIGNADLTQDFVLPTATITVTVKDGSGNPVSGAPVSISPGQAYFAIVPGGAAHYINGTGRNATTDTTGDATLTYFRSTYAAGQICATISGSQTCNTSSVTVSGPTSVALQQPPRHTLSGYLRDGNGNPVPSVTIQFRNYNTGTVASASATDSTGHYSLTANAGIYNVNNIGGTAPAPIGSLNIGDAYGSSTGAQYDISNGDLAQDFVLPTAPITVTVKDNTGNPVSGTTTSISPGQAYFAIVPGGAMHYINGTGRNATTDTTGTATLTYFKTTYAAGQICATIAGSQTCNTSPVVVSGPTSVTLQQPPQHTLSGYLRDGNGNPVSAVTIQFRNYNTGSTVSATATDSTGHYSLTTNAGIYNVNNIGGTAPAPIGSLNIGDAYGSSTGAKYDISNGDLTQDFVLPTAAITVTVKDGFGNPVSSAPVSISPGQAYFAIVPGGAMHYINGTGRNATTDTTGTANLIYFQSTYAAGQICATINGSKMCNTTSIAVGGPTSLLFQSAPQAPPAPIGLSAASPTSSAPQLSWNAVSVASSYNVYRNGTKIGSTSATSFADSALTISGTYSYTVTAVSALNVESSASSAVSVVFYGQGPIVTNVQVSPNTISVNQSATLSASVSDANAIVTAAEYFEGADPGIGNGTPMPNIVAGVASATLPSTLSVGQHTFTVRAKDSLGNWTTGTLPTATLTVTLPILNGKVLNGANTGISGVRVDVISQTDHTNIIATTTTDSSGNYAVSVSTPGTYDVIYTPSGDTYKALTKTSVNLTSSATVDVVLVLAPRVFDGYVMDQNHQAVHGATVSLHNQGGQTYSATTDDQGYFSATVNQAAYSVTVSGTKAAAPSAYVPDSFTLSGGSFDLTSNRSQTFTVHALTAHFTTKNDLTLATVGNVSLNISTTTNTAQFAGTDTYTGSAAYTVTTDASGSASVVMLQDTTYSIVATPSANSGVVMTSFPAAGPVSGDFDRDLPLMANIRHFSGHFTNNMTGVPGATVRLTGQNGTFQGTTNADGSFDVTAVAGSYSYTLDGSKPSGSTLAIPDTYSFSGGSIALSSGDAMQDLMFDTTTVTVTAESSFGATIPGVSVTLTSAPGNASLFLGSTFAATASSTGTTDSNGEVTLYVTRCLAYATKAVPASGSGYTTTNLAAGDPACAPTSWPVSLNRDLKTLQGTVQDANGKPVVGATIRLDGNEPDEHYTTTSTYDGSYSLEVAPYSAYSMQVSGNSSTQSTSSSAVLPDNFTLTGAVSVTGATTDNVTVSAVPVDIYARDNRMNAISDVAINFSSSGSQGGFAASSSNISRTTGDTGHASVNMLTGTTYTISATPQPNEGYVATTFNGTSPITQATQVLIQFQNHIPLPPTNLHAKSPTNTAPVLSWDSVDGADHYIVYRDGVNIGPATATSYTDSALAADGSYSYQVSAVSADNYESPLSNTVQVVYDTTPPAIHYALSSPPNTNGWNNGSVTMTFDCSDALSGIATCPPPEGQSVDGVYDLSATAIDNAGNQTTITPEIKIDQTAPTIAYALSPAPNPGGWNNSDVIVTFNCSDATSGIDYCSPPVTVSTETDGVQIPGKAVDAAGNESDITATIKLDKTAPTVTGPTWSANPLTQGQSTLLSASASDNQSGSGVASVYYTLDGGAPQQMTYDAVSDTWQATFGATLAVNTYNVSVYAVDTAGNASAPMKDVLAVTTTANGHVSGHAWIIPSASDTLPIAPDTSTTHPTQMVVGFSGQQGTTTSVDVHYVVKNNQNEFDFSSTAVDWVVIPDGTHASIMVHGDLTTYANGAKTVTQGVAMRLDIVLGASGAADQVTVRMWNPGLNPSMSVPTYQMSDSDLPNQSQILIQ